MFLKPFINAPVDIMIMLLGAFCIGYGVAWLLRNQRIDKLQEASLKLQKETGELQLANEDLDGTAARLQKQLDRCIESKKNLTGIEEIQQVNEELKKERERSEVARQSLIEIESAHEMLKHGLQLKIDQMLTHEKANKLRAEVNQLREFNSNLEEELRKMKGPELMVESINKIKEDALINKGDGVVASGQDFVSSIGIKTALEGEKDDLKTINGVGPFIEQKLNQIGIYTFAQIASLTNDQAGKITEEIEFFPGRIQRDDWVGQARKLGNMGNR